ncbi:hypothetical protein J0X14_13580 [Muricauda sp. CAU 1633]|uniref:hypothetical protein n=1 Tax=Allomuricauda sp. CAU 1633 TaxID=2816036 RepID=UPI001A8F4536|nr:hypothetical protein [Muricauda sp. CAU 1633]MBO0323334.1 hypothetical protein [Muricauda sp. CAU 1633]
MGGEGSMMHAIKSLKENRSLLKKRKLKSKDDVYGRKSITKLYFKKSTPRDINRIKKMMFIQKEKEKRGMFYAAIATVLLFFIFYLLLT